MNHTVLQYKIRPYDGFYYDQLVELLGKVYGSQINRDCLEEKYITDSRSILIAVEEKKSKVLGCAFLEIQKDYIRPRSILYVTYVAVDNSFRKQGIGRALFKEIEKTCMSSGCSAIELTSADYRTDAHAFYESLGFSRKKTTLFIMEI